ncbi:hypothetical protein PG985_005387 [Apiospora marii]|uniref:Uncharacterized protein n=1 Tax=Apiospora marii TaxID=335849 RepID=A0ABR1SC08_9PEZI
MVEITISRCTVSPFLDGRTSETRQPLRKLAWFDRHEAAGCNTSGFTWLVSSLPPNVHIVH